MHFASSKGLQTEFASIGRADIVSFKEWIMKVQTGIKAGRAVTGELSHGGKPRPIGKGV